MLKGSHFHSLKKKKKNTFLFSKKNKNYLNFINFLLFFRVFKKPNFCFFTNKFKSNFKHCRQSRFFFLKNLNINKNQSFLKFRRGKLC